MAFQDKDKSRNSYMLDGKLAHNGYDWWWHSLTAVNAVNGEEKPFFIEFFTCNPALSDGKITLGQAKENRINGRKPSYLMVKAGCWGENATQLHRFFPMSDTEIGYDTDGFSVRCEDCILSETMTHGKVEVTDAESHPEWMCGNGTMEWNLKIKKIIPFNVGYGASRLFRRINAFEMYWHAEGMKTQYEGFIIFNGEKYIVSPETSYGYADKNWGADFTSPWVWLSSNNLTSRISGKQLTNSVFDLGGGRPRIYGIALDRKLLGAFYHEGTGYEFNFSKFWSFCRTSFECQETDDEIVWKVVQTTLSARWIVDIRCRKKDMLLVNYEAPSGEKRHNRLWNGGNGTGRIQLFKRTISGFRLIDDIDAMNVGCEYGEFD